MCVGRFGLLGRLGRRLLGLRLVAPIPRRVTVHGLVKRRNTARGRMRLALWRRFSVSPGRGP
eukprot:1872510-Lingulodinium_polyedra.AAC.1